MTHPITILGKIARDHGPIGFHADGGIETPSNVQTPRFGRSDVALQSQLSVTETVESGPTRYHRARTCIRYGCSAPLRRANAKYCSGACKQVAYRERLASGTGG
jgi:hypothetical protein